MTELPMPIPFVAVVQKLVVIASVSISCVLLLVMAYRFAEGGHWEQLWFARWMGRGEWRRRSGSGPAKPGGAGGGPTPGGGGGTPGGGGSGGSIGGGGSGGGGKG